MQERPEHTRPLMHPVGPRKQGFIHMADVRAQLWHVNKIAASAHGMGSGCLAVDVMVIGCLGVDRRVERFFILSHFRQPGSVFGVKLLSALRPRLRLCTL